MSRAEYPVLYDPVYGCWRWTERLSHDGYALTRAYKLAHRAVYEAEVGPIPEKHVVDHICRRRDCVAPHHLEAVKPRENERRKIWGYGVKQAKCRNGHDMYTHGRRTPEGGRICTICSGVKQEH